MLSFIIRGNLLEDQTSRRIFCAEEPSGGRLASMTKVDLTISARKEAVAEPWLWRLGQDFKVRVNIVKANVDSDFGWVHVQLEGPVEEIQRATAWLMTTGMHVEAQQRAVGA